MDLLEEEDVEEARCLYGPNRDKLIECGLVTAIQDAICAPVYVRASTRFALICFPRPLKFRCI